MSRDLSPILPSSVQVRFLTRRCAGAANAGFPRWYTSNVAIGSVTSPVDVSGYAGAPGMKLFNSSALALQVPPTADPTNKSTLDLLSSQLASDFYAWSSISFDEVYNGLLPLSMSALYDEVEFTHTESDVTTRVRTAPCNASPEETFAHDPDNSTCADNLTTTPPTVVTKEPAFQFVGPPVSTPSTGQAEITSYLGSLTDGRLAYKFFSDATLDCACSGTSTPCDMVIEFWTCASVGNTTLCGASVVVTRDSDGATIFTGLTCAGVGAATIQFAVDVGACYTATVSLSTYETQIFHFCMIAVGVGGCDSSAGFRVNTIPGASTPYSVAGTLGTDLGCSSCYPNGGGGCSCGGSFFNGVLYDISYGVGVATTLTASTDGNSTASYTFNNGVYTVKGYIDGGMVNAGRWVPWTGTFRVEPCTSLPPLGGCIGPEPGFYLFAGNPQTGTGLIKAKATDFLLCGYPFKDTLFITDPFYGVTVGMDVVALTGGQSCEVDYYEGSVGGIAYPGYHLNGFSCPAETLKVYYRVTPQAGGLPILTVRAESTAIPQPAGSCFLPSGSGGGNVSGGGGSAFPTSITVSCNPLSFTFHIGFTRDGTTLYPFYPLDNTNVLDFPVTE